MKLRQVGANTITVNAAMIMYKTVQVKWKRWQFISMRMREVGANTISYNAAIILEERAEMEENILPVLLCRVMLRLRVRANSITFNAAILVFKIH